MWVLRQRKKAWMARARTRWLGWSELPITNERRGPNCGSSGSPGALLRRGPFRTGRARFPGNRLKQALLVCGRAEVPSRCRRRQRGGGSGCA